MPEQNRIRPQRRRLIDDAVEGHRPELAVDQSHLMAVIEQRTTDAEQAERRQLLPRDAASDRRMGDIDQEDAHL